LTLIVAFDRSSSKDGKEVIGTISKICNMVSGVKLGIPLFAKHGATIAREVREVCRNNMIIADLKLADIGDIMISTAEVLLPHVDAFIAHSFIGREGALDDLKSYLDSRGSKLILVASMSHKGSTEVYDKEIDSIASVIKGINPWGIVAPATRPEVIGRLRESLGKEIKILSPGVGVQGAKPGVALCNGADFEIVGRYITNSSNPVETTKLIIYEQKRRLDKCRR